MHIPSGKCVSGVAASAHLAVPALVNDNRNYMSLDVLQCMLVMKSRDDRTASSEEGLPHVHALVHTKSVTSATSRTPPHPLTLPSLPRDHIQRR